jgi:hypothetical protein
MGNFVRPFAAHLLSGGLANFANAAGSANLPTRLISDP